MKIAEKSIFNLIEVFGNTRKSDLYTITPKTHCDQRHHHDFYCDAEKPFVSNI
ncbi:MAG: hypothetical protein AAGA43_09890 [Bacteroidota bacterium]